MKYSILIADDETNSREGLKKALVSDDRTVDTAEDGDKAYSKLKKRQYDALLTDIRMPGKDGMTLLKEAKKLDPTLDVIVLTAYGTIEMAVDAMKHGAYNYLTKPVNLDELDILLEQLVEKKRLALEHEYLKEQKKELAGFEGIVGQSAPMKALLDQIQQIAETKATVLITGETGTGKELVARAIHSLSNRSGRIFVPVHCAALSENLLESELFGHERGAFTGAVNQRKGRFELADGGTIFLDEISEISQSIQVKLLRVLQEKKFERVGSTDTISVDIRIIAASNVDLQKMVNEGNFRQDLYYRLKVVTLHVPPLRERLDDIPLLVDSFVERYAKENRKGKLSVDRNVYPVFQNYSWPGNVRELQGVIESMVVLAKDSVLTVDQIPYDIRKDYDQSQPSTNLQVGDSTLADVEKQVILQTLEKYNGNRTKTAEALGIGRRTLIRKLHEYSVDHIEEGAEDET